MDISKLELFMAAAREESFTKAAEECHVTQGAVSKYITALEKELGVPLFHRKTRTTRLTLEGQRFYEGLLPLRQDWQTLLASLSAPDLHDIRLGTTEPAYSRLPILTDFQKKDPRFSLYFSPGSFAALAEKLTAGTLDGILCTDAEDIPATCRTTALQTAPLFIYVSGKVMSLHPSTKLLVDAMPLITRYTSAAYLHKQRERFWKSYGAVFRTTIPAASEMDEWNAAAEGKGFLLRPKWTGPRFHGVTTQTLPKIFSQTLFLVYPGTPSPALSRLLTFIHDKLE